MNTTDDQAEFDAAMEELCQLASQVLATGGALLPLDDTTIYEQVTADVPV